MISAPRQAFMVFTGKTAGVHDHAHNASACQYAANPDIIDPAKSRGEIGKTGGLGGQEPTGQQISPDTKNDVNAGVGSNMGGEHMV